MDKKAQEEMVGFIMIVVVVTIIGLVFLGFALRPGKSSGERESSEVHQFLESSMEFSSECAIGYVPAYAKLGELLKECYRNSQCLNGKSACEVLNSTLSAIIEESYSIGEERSLKGFELNSSYALSGNGTRTPIIGLSRGTCNGEKIGAEYFSPASPGIITTDLKLCY